MGKPYKRLKAYRQLKEIKQKELGDILGISLNSYNAKENGKNSFTLEEAKMIADLFKTSIEEIFFKGEVCRVGTDYVQIFKR